MNENLNFQNLSLPFPKSFPSKCFFFPLSSCVLVFGKILFSHIFPFFRLFSFFPSFPCLFSCPANLFLFPTLSPAFIPGIFAICKYPSPFSHFASFFAFPAILIPVFPIFANLPHLQQSYLVLPSLTYLPPF